MLDSYQERSFINFEGIFSVIKNFPSERLGLLSIKPGFHPIDQVGYLLRSVVEGLFRSVHLKVLAASTRILDLSEIYQLYYGLYNPRIEQNPTLEKIRSELLVYMSEGVTLSYLLEGDKALDKADEIKWKIRDYYGFPRGSTQVRNAVHVPDRCMRI